MYILTQTKSGNYGVQTHPDKILRDLDFADDIVLLDENIESYYLFKGNCIYNGT